MQFYDLEIMGDFYDLLKEINEEEAKKASSK